MLHFSIKKTFVSSLNWFIERDKIPQDINQTKCMYLPKLSSLTRERDILSWAMDERCGY